MFENVAAESYDAFMGRFSTHLPAQMIALAGVAPGMRVLDVGSGPGALATALADVVGAAEVAAVDPAPAFVDAIRDRRPGVEAHIASAEELPFTDDSFDAALAQLVVHFMADPEVGIAEMVRVTRPGGRVAACVWDQESRRSPLSLFAEALDAVSPHQPTSVAAGTVQGHLEELFVHAGLTDVRGVEMSASATFATFDEWFAPYRLGMGSMARRTAALTVAQWAELEAACRGRLPVEPFSITGWAWAAVGTVPSSIASDV